MKHRILIVDDDEAVLQSLRMLLRRDRDRWEIRFALGGAAALRELAEEPVDLVVCDLGMAGVDGETVLARGRATSPQTGRIVLSGTFDETELASVRDVVDVLLEKPCQVATLREAIASLLARSAA